MKLSLFLIPILVWVNYSDISPDSIPIKWPSDNCFIRSARLPISPTAEAFIPISGKYSWSFKIPLMGTQVMTYAFSGQTIDVTMTGSVLDRAYKLSVISFDQVKNKIGARTMRNKEVIYAVIFIKDIRHNRATIFKKEFSTLKEANEFGIPPANSTDSRGWNVFIKNGN